MSGLSEEAYYVELYDNYYHEEWDYLRELEERDRDSRDEDGFYIVCPSCDEQLLEVLTIGDSRELTRNTICPNCGERWSQRKDIPYGQPDEIKSGWF